jgi:hypothetical protein
MCKCYIYTGGSLSQPLVKMHYHIRLAYHRRLSFKSTACGNASSQAVGSSDTALFIPQARDN